MRKAVVAVPIVLIVFVVGLWLGFKVSRTVGAYTQPKFYDTTALLRQIQTVSQLVTVKYVFEKVTWVDEPSTNLLGMLFAGQNRVLLLAHGIVKAGIDFEKMKPDDIRVEGQRVTLNLPRAVITDAYLDDRKTQVIERTTGLFREFNKDLEQTARALAVSEIQHAARENGILKDAGDRARLQLENLCRQLGFTEVKFGAP